MGAAAASTHCFTHRLVGPTQHTHSASLLPTPGKIFQSLFKIATENDRNKFEKFNWYKKECGDLAPINMSENSHFSSLLNIKPEHTSIM
jgi:hypothetical protein